MSKVNHEELMKKITADLIAEIEKGSMKWERMWTAHWPKNIGSGKLYTGFNAMYLQALSNQRKYSYPFFITYKQAQQMGGTVKKGERSTLIVFWKIWKESDESKADFGKTKFYPFYWNVFNIDQCEGIEFDIPEPLKVNNHGPIKAAQQVIDNYKDRPKIVNKENERAYYSPMNDLINMPDKTRFNTSQSFYQVLFHEAVHSTGHHSRLNRLKTNICSPFGSTEYSKEELVAELGSSYLCFHAGILEDTFKNSAAYLQGWVREFKDKPEMLYSAGNHAMKAVQHILGIENEVKPLNTEDHE